MIQSHREKFKQMIDDANQTTHSSFFKHPENKHKKSEFVTKEEFIRRLNLVDYKTIQG